MSRQSVSDGPFSRLTAIFPSNVNPSAPPSPATVHPDLNCDANFMAKAHGVVAGEAIWRYFPSLSRYLLSVSVNLSFTLTTRTLTLSFFPLTLFIFFLFFPFVL